MDLRVPMEIPLGGQMSSLIEAWDCASLSWCKRVIRPPVELRTRSRGTMGNSGSLSCCLSEVKFPFELQGRVRECSGVTAGESGLNSHGRANLKMFLEVWQEVWVPSSCHGDLREPLILFLRSQNSFGVVRGLSGFLSSWCRG